MPAPQRDFAASTDELLGYNTKLAENFDDAELPVKPLRQLAVVACMDSRINTFKILGLGNGDAHIIRNAGGVITDDVIRSLCLSQRALGTREIILVHHTDCGLEKLDEAQLRHDLEAEVGVRPCWSVETFNDPYQDVAQSIRRLQLSPFLRHKDHIRGFVYDVNDGRLNEVVPTDSAG